MEKHKGTVIVNIEPELHDILLDWMEINKSDYLLSSYFKGRKEYNVYSEGTLCRRVSVIFQKYTKVPVSINSLRHSFISYKSKYDQEYNKKKENAHKMMHTPSMAEKYRRMVYLS
jgi:hypothetical protein